MKPTEKKQPSNPLLLWIDLEMTGLDENKDHILELAAVFTNYDLEILATQDYIVYQSPEILEGMNTWCQEHHTASGLKALIAGGIPLSELEIKLLDWIEGIQGKNAAPLVLAGNSIGQDRRFIERHMPKLAALLHYRMVDVSSFKEIFRNRYQLEYKKTDQHRAVQDIMESIQELNYYLSFVKLTTP